MHIYKVIGQVYIISFKIRHFPKIFRNSGFGAKKASFPQFWETRWKTFCFPHVFRRFPYAFPQTFPQFRKSYDEFPKILCKVTTGFCLQTVLN